MRWIIIALLAFIGWQWWSERDIGHPPGVLAPQAPLQRPLAGAPPVLQKAGYRIEPLARFALEARVLGVERYRFDRGAGLAPVDLALGWGRMSDTAVLNSVDVSQSGRFYYWRVQEFPIPRREIETSSANMHMVPADESIAKRLKSVHRGDIVALNGYLIEAHGPDGFDWKSSLTRNDTGNGACELVWVDRLEVR